jgi:hypothetical protein
VLLLLLLCLMLLLSRTAIAALQCHSRLNFCQRCYEDARSAATASDMR